MNPRKQFCHNQDCWAYGRPGEGHIVVHSQEERRYRCKRCRATFSQTKGTALYRVHKPHELFLLVLTLLAYGSPVQAIVAAFGLDERSLAGKKKPALSAGGCKSTWWRPEAWSSLRFRPTSCAYGWWAGSCGWRRLWR